MPILNVVIMALLLRAYLTEMAPVVETLFVEMLQALSPVVLTAAPQVLKLLTLPLDPVEAATPQLPLNLARQRLAALLRTMAPLLVLKAPLALAMVPLKAAIPDLKVANTILLSTQLLLKTVPCALISPVKQPPQTSLQLL